MQLINGKWHRLYNVHRVLSYIEGLHGRDADRVVSVEASSARDAARRVTETHLTRVIKVVVAATGEELFEGKDFL